ncbi:hypothetical protein GSI_04097 [Ganoderma sinense ZZ0214-1]|uniref:Uncharacterized protein n=1 Tax=Ganoderma sinense ZZ0214-1 TaxID=1077348 RepID=A0A2G8SI75_9APHY|nr:hypothetical protein GSI_04097 [Ganoderma sinense ZZ0214-1]
MRLRVETSNLDERRLARALIFVVEGLEAPSFFIIQGFPGTAKYLTDGVHTFVVYLQSNDAQFPGVGESLKWYHIWHIVGYRTYASSCLPRITNQLVFRATAATLQNTPIYAARHADASKAKGPFILGSRPPKAQRQGHVTSAVPRQQRGEVNKGNDLRFICGPQPLTRAKDVAVREHFDVDRNIASVPTATMPSSSGPSPDSLPPPAATSRARGSQPTTTTHVDSNKLLCLMGEYACPSSQALKSGEVPPLNSLANMVAKLCLYSATVDISERHKLLSSTIDTEELHKVVAFILSVPQEADVTKRLELTKEFSGEVEKILDHFAIWCRSWGPTPRNDIPPKEAAKLLCGQAMSAGPNETDVMWSFLLFTFGEIPELWGIRTPGSSDRPSRPKPSGASVGGKGKAPAISYTSPLAQLKENAAVADVEPARHTAPMLEDQTTDSNATLPDTEPGIFQHPDLIAFLSNFEILEHFSGSELFTLLHAALDTTGLSTVADNKTLNAAKRQVLSLLHEFRQVHGDFVNGLLILVRVAGQWHTWGLEVRYFHEKHGVSLPPQYLDELRELFTFLNGFTILVYQLMHQQACFRPPEA